LLEAGKMLLYIMVALILFSIYWSMREAQTLEVKTKAVRDRDETLQTVLAIPPERAVTVYAEGKDYLIQLLGPGNPVPQCLEKPCICIIEADNVPKCDVLEGLTTDCAKDRPCVAQEQDLGKHHVTEGAGIPVCRKGPKLYLGDKC